MMLAYLTLPYDEMACSSVKHVAALIAFLPAVVLRGHRNGGCWSRSCLVFEDQIIRQPNLRIHFSFLTFLL